MNSNERQMTEILKRGAEFYGYTSVKAEFEAEGTRPDELLRLVEIARSAGLPLTVKIGGCEAIRDLYESKQSGVRFTVAPMVETAYALSKYVAAAKLVYGPEDMSETEFLFNIETTTGFENARNIVDLAAASPNIHGIVFGRVDYVGSLGRNRDSINDDDITANVIELAKQCKRGGLDLVVGGGVSRDSVACLREIRAVHLTRFETRKVVFRASALDTKNIAQGLLDAVHFELLWLMNKREYYGNIYREDARRIEMLENRWNVLKQPAA